MENLPKNPENDEDLEKIRYYKGTWKNFFDFWKKRGVETDPYKGTILKYPEERKQKENTLPIQDFGTYDKSKMNNRIAESLEEFIKEYPLSEKDLD